MGRRTLSPDEVAKLKGAQSAPPTRRTLSPEEVAALSPPPVEAAPVAPPAEDPGMLSTLGHAALAGFLKQGSDEAAGALTSAVVDPGGGAAWKQPNGTMKMLSTEDDIYRAGRDTERRNLAAGKEYHPIVDFLGRLGGDVASDAAAAAFGVPVLSSSYQVPMGAISGVLGSDAELTTEGRTPETVAESTASAGLGAGLGYVAPKIGEAIARVSPMVMRGVRTAAENLAVRMGRRVLQGGSDLAAARFKETPPEAILEALRSGGIVPFGTTQGAYSRLQRLAEERGDVYGGILDELEGLGVQGPDAQKLADELYERSLKIFSETGANKEVSREFATQGQSLIDLSPEDTGRLGLKQAEAIKRDLQDRARFGRLEDTPLNEAKKEISSRVRQANEDAISEAAAADPLNDHLQGLAESFVPVKQQLGNTIAARNLAEKGTARIAGRNSVGLREAMMGAMTSGGDPVTGTLNAAGFSALKSRLPSAGASGAYGLSRLAAAGARGAANNPALMSTAGKELGAGAGRTAQQGIEDYLSRTSPDPKSRAELTSGELVEALASAEPETLGPYADQLQRASVDGNLPLVHYMLQQKDPQYRAMLEAARAGGTE